MHGRLKIVKSINEMSKLAAYYLTDMTFFFIFDLYTISGYQNKWQALQFALQISNVEFIR